MSLSSYLLTFCKYLSIYSECYTSIHVVKFHNVFLTVQRQCYTFWLRLHFCFNEGSMFCTWNVLPFEVHKKDFASPTHCITHCHNALEKIGKEKKNKKERERHKPQVSSVFSAQPYSHDSPAVKTEVTNYSWVWKNSLTPSKCFGQVWAENLLADIPPNCLTTWLRLQILSAMVQKSNMPMISNRFAEWAQFCSKTSDTKPRNLCTPDDSVKSVA